MAKKLLKILIKLFTSFFKNLKVLFNYPFFKNILNYNKIVVLLFMVFDYILLAWFSIYRKNITRTDT
jgi:hypothetical protein